MTINEDNSIATTPSDAPTENEMPFVKGRTAARLAAIQALYQLDMEPAHPTVVIQQFINCRFTQPEKFHFIKPDKELFAHLVKGVIENQAMLDPAIQDVLSSGWTLERLETVIRAILRAGLFELTQCPDTPTAVILNEYVNLTKAFYAGLEPGFVNASLDALAKKYNRA